MEEGAEAAVREAAATCRAVIGDRLPANANTGPRAGATVAWPGVPCAKRGARAWTTLLGPTASSEAAPTTGRSKASMAARWVLSPTSNSTASGLGDSARRSASSPSGAVPGEPA